MTAGFFMPAVLVAGFTNSLHPSPQAVFLGVVQAVELSALVGYCRAVGGVVTSGWGVRGGNAPEVGRLVQRAGWVPEAHATARMPPRALRCSMARIARSIVWAALFITSTSFTASSSGALRSGRACKVSSHAWYSGS